MNLGCISTLTRYIQVLCGTNHEYILTEKVVLLFLSYMNDVYVEAFNNQTFLTKMVMKMQF